MQRTRIWRKQSSAAKDLNIWLDHLCRLQDIPYQNPLSIKEVIEFSDQDNSSLKLNIDILASGYHLLNPEADIIFIRRDPFSKIMIRSGSRSSPTMIAREHDYFELEVSEPIT